MSVDLILVAASLFTWGMGEGLFMYFIPLSLQAWGADPVLIGAVLGGVGLAISVAQVPAGWFADKFGPRYLMWAGWICGTAASLLMAFASSLWMFVIGLWIYYFTAFAVAPMNTYIVMARDKLSVSRALTLVSGLFNLGAAAGPLIGGLIAEKLGLQTVYLISSLVFIVSTIILFFAKEKKPVRRPQSISNRSALLSPRLISFILFAMITVFVLYLPQPLTSNYLKDVKHFSEAQIGVLGTIGNIGNALAALTLGGINPDAGLILGQASVLVYSLILWQAEKFGFFGAAYFILGGYRLARNMITSKIRSFVGEHQVGLAFGILETACGISIILSPLLAGLLFKASTTLPYKVSIPLILILLIASTIFLKKTRRESLSSDE